MTKTFVYPISYKQTTDGNDDLCWVGEQKQLGIRCVEYGYYDCKDAVEREINRELVGRFDVRYGAGITCDTIAVRAEARVTVRRNATLAEFGIGVADDGLTDEAVLQRAQEVGEHADALTEQLHGLRKDFVEHLGGDD